MAKEGEGRVDGAAGGSSAYHLIRSPLIGEAIIYPASHVWDPYHSPDLLTTYGILTTYQICLPRLPHICS